MARLSKALCTAQLYISSKINILIIPLWKSVYKLQLLGAANKAVGDATSTLNPAPEAETSKSWFLVVAERKQNPNPGALSAEQGRGIWGPW